MADPEHNVESRIVTLSGYSIASGFSPLDWSKDAWAKVMEDLWDEYSSRLTRNPCNDIPSTDSTFNLDNLLPKLRTAVKKAGSLFVYNCEGIPGETDIYVVVVSGFKHKFASEADFDKAMEMAETRMASENALENGDTTKQASLLSDYDDLLDEF